MVAYVVWLGDNSSQAAGAVEGFFGQDVEVAGAEDEDAAGGGNGWGKTGGK